MRMSLASILESLFFATDEPLTLERLLEVIPGENAESLKAALSDWRQRLIEDESRGLQLLEVAGGFLLATRPQNSEFVDRLLERRKKRTLSQAALETLSVIAYREPITRAEIEAIRGVNVDSMIHTLLQRRLIKISGRKEVPGHPFLYRTTKHFLHHFGLRSLTELPKIDELSQALADAEGRGDGAGTEATPAAADEAGHSE
ncbi:MAG: SMC-Scp complex subunit ScpB [Candidatus Omnitrophica bacterium COP1]|nr:SMC-Scp complex subunit ScpB [Candidatus Omnitrophica bacterium COP1]